MSNSEKNEKEIKQAEEAAQSLRKAMKGIGTDEKKIINTLVNFNNKQRQLIKTKYEILTGRELIVDLNNELSGLFFEAIEILLIPTDEYEALTVRHALCDDLTTDEKKCIQLLAPKDSNEIKTLRSTYNRLMRCDVEKHILSETHGDFSKTLMALVSGKRHMNHGFDLDEIRKQATKLYDAGQGKIGTDEDEYIRIFTTYSFSELYTLFAIYAQISGDSVEKAVNKETSGDFRDTLLTIIKCVQNKPAYFAEQIYECMAGAGTDEKELFQLIVRRSDIDLPLIKKEYKKKYKWSLYDRVKDELSGDLKNLMLALIGPD